MIPLLLIHSDLEIRAKESEKFLEQNNLKRPHPDLLWVEEEKLGVEQAKQIRNHLTLKPYQADKRAIVLLHAHNLTPDAQNSLLKTLEEPLGDPLIILGVSQEDSLLPTISSRCQLVYVEGSKQVIPYLKLLEQIDKLSTMTAEQRFQVIEKVTDRDEFLEALVYYFQQKLEQNPTLVDAQKGEYVLEAQKWAAANVNTRAILEYLMLSLYQDASHQP
jgi:DNA polymerase III delta prime subunit